MNTHLKTILSAALTFVLLVSPGLSHIVHEAGGPEAVVAAAVTLSVLVHAIIDRFTGSPDEDEQ